MIHKKEDEELQKKDRAKRTGKSRESDKENDTYKVRTGAKTSYQDRIKSCMYFVLAAFAAASHGIRFFCVKGKGQHTGWICGPFCACYGKHMD